MIRAVSNMFVIAYAEMGECDGECDVPAVVNCVSIQDKLNYC